MPKAKSNSKPAAVRPLRRLTQVELNEFMQNAANKLRGNVDHSEFRGYFFALLFFKRISDVYDEKVRELLQRYDGEEDMARDTLSNST